MSGKTVSPCFLHLLNHKWVLSGIKICVVVAGEDLGEDGSKRSIVPGSRGKTNFFYIFICCVVGYEASLRTTTSTALGLFLFIYYVCRSNLNISVII